MMFRKGYDNESDEKRNDKKKKHEKNFNKKVSETEQLYPIVKVENDNNYACNVKSNKEWDGEKQDEEKSAKTINVKEHFEGEQVSAKLAKVVEQKVKERIEDKVIVSVKKLEEMFRKWQKYPTNDVQGSCEDTDDQSKEKRIRKRNRKIKTSRQTNDSTQTERLIEMSKQKTSAGGAGGGGSSGHDSNSDSDTASVSKRVGSWRGGSSGDDSSSDSDTASVPKRGGAGGGGSSGHDSNFDSDTASVPKREERETSHTKIPGTKSIHKWNNAIKEKDEKAIKELLKADDLPSSNQLREALTIFGRKSNILTRICRYLSHMILDLHRDIVRVEPAYAATDEDDVTFIIYFRQSKIDSTFKDPGFKVNVREFGQYTSEGKDIVDQENLLHFDLEEANKLRECIKTHSESLMKQHSNLLMISASHFRSSRFGSGKPEEATCKCVVYYVRVKGFIPLVEDSLPKELDGIPTDVREGGFDFLSKANERHNNLKMGCEIGSALKFRGTLGPFLEQDGYTYALTAAHVLYGIPPSDSTEYEWPSIEVGTQQPIHVYQPSIGASTSKLKHKPFGSVYCAIYKKGDCNVPGVDVAAILIEDKSRLPVSAEFPEPEQGSSMQVDDEIKVEYNSGEICPKDFLTNNTDVKVLKFGSATGETHGKVHIDGTSVRCDNCITGDNKGIFLHQQIEISNFGCDKFADYGDSGAVVLAEYPEHRRELRALGLLTGKTSNGTTLITPMHAIFDVLGIKDKRFKAFTNVTPSNILETPADIQIRFESIENNMAVIENKVAVIENNMAAIGNNVVSNNIETTTLSSKVDALYAKVDQNHLELQNSLGNFLHEIRQVVQGNIGNASNGNQSSGN